MTSACGDDLASPQGPSSGGPSGASDPSSQGGGSSPSGGSTNGSGTPSIVDPQPSGGADSSTSVDTSSQGGTTKTTTSSDVTGNDTTSSSSDSGVPTGNASDCKPGELYCAPGLCCEASQECINRSCLANCPSTVRCGADLSQCCAAGELCHGTRCVAPGAGCKDDVDCPAEHYCEALQGKCLPQLDTVHCEIRPKFSDVSLDFRDWTWDGGDVISIPVVADLDGDGVNEVVVNTTYERRVPELAPSIEHGSIVILSGKDGSVQVKLEEGGVVNGTTTFGSSGRSTVAVGDVDGDGFPDIIYAGRKSADTLSVDNGNNDYTNHDSLIRAYSYKKNQNLWVSHTGGPDTAAGGYAERKILVHNGALTMANLDDDPEAEVVIGNVVLDNDGEVVWPKAADPIVQYGAPLNYAGAISVVADVKSTNDRPEIISGRNAWEISEWTQGSGATPASVTLTELWNADGVNAGVSIEDGYPAIADLDLDGSPEVILVSGGKLSILEGLSGKLWCGKGNCPQESDRTQPYALPGTGIAPNGVNNYGGPATIADFDGDGRPEIGIADYLTYAVYDFKRNLGGVEETVPDTGTIPAKANLQVGDIFTRWRASTQDRSSSATGASVFDFQGDGAAEVVYADECSLHVYDGKTGSSLRQLSGSSATIHEYPVVVDVDNDGQTEILVVANKVPTGTGQACPDTRSGIFVYGDRKERWVPTRPVWTQHSYHVTNADSKGNPPSPEANNWERKGLNNYRQNTQGYGVFNAPDLKVKLSADLDTCDSGFVTLVATVRNGGARGVAKGVEVNFFRGKNSSGEQIGFERTQVALLPGASTRVTIKVPASKGTLLPDHFVHVDGVGQTAGAIAECKEDNNWDVLSGVGCPAQ